MWRHDGRELSWSRRLPQPLRFTGGGTKHVAIDVDGGLVDVLVRPRERERHRATRR
jgi:hypothetical protein